MRSAGVLVPLVQITCEVPFPGAAAASQALGASLPALPLTDREATERSVVVPVSSAVGQGERLSYPTESPVWDSDLSSPPASVRTPGAAAYFWGWRLPHPSDHGHGDRALGSQ